MQERVAVLALLRFRRNPFAAEWTLLFRTLVGIASVGRSGLTENPERFQGGFPFGDLLAFGHRVEWPIAVRATDPLSLHARRHIDPGVTLWARQADRRGGLFPGIGNEMSLALPTPNLMACKLVR
jgi:hypothetical protein